MKRRKLAIEAKTYSTHSSYKTVNNMAINQLFFKALKAIRIHSFLKVYISKSDVSRDTQRVSV